MNRLLASLPLVAATLGLAGAASAAESSKPEEAAEKAYAAAAGSKGVVLMDVYWSRVWKCGRFENAQLRSLEFTKAPLGANADEAGTAPLLLENPSRLAPPRHFVSYAFLVDPGDYHLTAFEVGFASSISAVGVTRMKPADLVADGRSKAGSFRVAAGELVYIGNFGIDCYKSPIPWRYYTQGRADFAEHLAQYREKYPFLDTTKVVYRLFDTTAYGEPYELH